MIWKTILIHGVLKEKNGGKKWLWVKIIDTKDRLKINLQMAFSYA